jgi:hypothetical protein
MAALSEKAVVRVMELFQRADLGDPRRVRRAVGLAENLAETPALSLPKVWSTPSELKAGYQFLRNPRVGFSSLMEAVQLATRELALQAKRVLVLHDTTDVACPCAEPDEVGHLQTGKAGFYVHHAFCVSADAENRPFGMLWSQVWGREQRSLGRKRNLSGPELAKLKHRESDRWLESVLEAHLWAEGCDQVVHVMDREADFFRLFEYMTDLGADFVVRLRHDRATEEGRLTERLVDAPIKLERLVELGPRKQKSMPSHTYHGRAARRAQLTVRCERVEFQALRHMPDSEPVAVNVVQVLEENPPAGHKPVAWVLATSLPLNSKTDIERVIDMYRARWQIEELHKALKTGCMLEKRQLESFESITTLLAICYPIAAELLRIRSRSRQKGLPATEVMRKSLLDCLRAHPKARPLPNEPTAEQALAVIAGLGGHIKYNGPPGWQTLAAGYMTLLAFEQGWLAAHAQRDF